MTAHGEAPLVLVLLVGGAVGYWIWPWAGPTTGLSGAAGAGGGRGAKTGQASDVTDIRLELLRRERGELSAPDPQSIPLRAQGVCGTACATAGRLAGQRPSKWRRPDRCRLRRRHRSHFGSSGILQPRGVHRPRGGTERRPGQRVQRERRRRDRRSLSSAAGWQ